MAGQHTENLLRRSKGKFLNIKGVSGAAYQGYVIEVTNDYVSLADSEIEPKTQVFVFFNAIESVAPGEPS